MRLYFRACSDSMSPLLLAGSDFQILLRGQNKSETPTKHVISYENYEQGFNRVTRPYLMEYLFQPEFKFIISYN